MVGLVALAGVGPGVREVGEVTAAELGLVQAAALWGL